VVTLGPETMVLEADRDSCPSLGQGFWVPDGPARAYRDRDGAVRLIMPHFLSYAMVGPRLEDVAPDCSDPIWQSDYDPDPANVDDAMWPWAPYRLPDGRVFMAFHHEFHGLDLRESGAWYPAITAGIADDGVHFQRFPLGQHVIAANSEPYHSGITDGYSDHSNILRNPRDGRYYLIALNRDPTSWGLCTLRTDDLLDVNAWRAFDGSGFASQTSRGDLCAKLQLDGFYAPGSLNYSRYLDKVVLLVFGHRHTDDAQGLFMFVAQNDELTEWSDSVFVVHGNVPWGDIASRTGRAAIFYPSFLDPDGGPNFDELGQEPYLLFERTHSGQPTRQVVRVKVRFERDAPEVDNRPPGFYRIGGGAYYSNGYGANGGAYCSIVGMDQLRACGWSWDFENLPEYFDHGANAPQNHPLIGLRCTCGLQSDGTLPEGCYRVGATGYYSNGAGRSCPFYDFQMPGICGTSDFWSLTPRADHGGNTVDPACNGGYLPQGCYRIGGTGYYSNGIGQSCAFLGNQLQAICGTADFFSLWERADHAGNTDVGGC